MQTVIIAAPGPLDVLARLSEHFATSASAGGSVVVEHCGERAYISPAPELHAEYDPEGLAAVLRLVPNPHFYTVDFSAIALCKEVLLALTADAAVAIDTDDGLVLPGDLFATRLREDPGWDWRMSSARPSVLP